LRESVSLLLQQRRQAAKGWTTFDCPEKQMRLRLGPPSLEKGANLEVIKRFCDPSDRLALPKRCLLQTGRCGYRSIFAR
jgi:hypothetical protein